MGSVTNDPELVQTLRQLAEAQPINGGQTHVGSTGDGRVFLAVTNAAGGYSVWTLDWKGAIWVAASLLLHARSPTVQGMPNEKALEETLAHLEDSLHRQVEGLAVALREQKEKP